MRLLCKLLHRTLRQAGVLISVIAPYTTRCILYSLLCRFQAFDKVVYMQARMSACTATHSWVQAACEHSADQA